MCMNRWVATVFTAALTLGGVLWPASPALADQRDISIGNVWICRLTRDASGFTSYQRAIEVRKRITEALSVPEFRKGTVVKVRQIGNDALVTVGNMLVFTVTPLDAKDSGVTPVVLARVWAQKLADGLSQALPQGPPFHF